MYLGASTIETVGPWTVLLPLWAASRGWPLHELTIPDVQRSIRALGKIAWINKVNDKYEVGITYLNMVKRDQDFIVRYILNEQIRRSKLRDIKNIRK